MDTRQIFEIKQQLNQFLEQHPHLKPLQAEIDMALKCAGNQNNRNVLLQVMMQEKVQELKTQVTQLQTMLNKLHNRSI